MAKPSVPNGHALFLGLSKRLFANKKKPDERLQHNDIVGNSLEDITTNGEVYNHFDSLSGRRTQQARHKVTQCLYITSTESSSRQILSVDHP